MSIDQYKTLLGYGARGNLYRVEFVLPTLVSTKYNQAANIDLMCHAVRLPKPRDIQIQTIQVWNESFTLATERDAYSELEIKFRSPEDFKMRNAFEYWQDIMQKPRLTVSGTEYDGARANPSDYKAKNIKIAMLSNDMTTIIRQAEFFDGFPTSVSAIGEVSQEADGTVQEVTVTLKFDHYIITSNDNQIYANTTAY